MRKITKILLVFVALLFLGVALIQSLAVPKEEEQTDVDALISTQEVSVAIQEAPKIDDLPLEDNMDLYQYDDPDSVVAMYITVRMGNPSDETDHTWQEVNDFTKFWFEDLTEDIPRAEAIVQIGDETGPLPGQVGYGEVVPNATIQIRGRTASIEAQKSYKIELRDRAGEWRGQTTIPLNKHVGDITRVRNKLCFDLMKDIPHLVSMRTQFVHLYVKDETADPPDEVFKDYGLYTQIEQPNGRFLRNHRLDRDAQFYKPNFFEFFRYPESIRLADDPLFNQGTFSEILEIKGSEDHTKLIQMLEDVNNFAIPIEQTFEKYFNADNYFTWMAFNILIGSVDTDAQNFYLYSPQNGVKWYFFPWDYDSVLSRKERKLYDSIDPYDYYAFGIANYWMVRLHRRVLMVDRYRKALDTRIKQVKSYLTPNILESKLDTYRKVTDRYLFEMPDVYYLRATKEEYEDIMEGIPNEININYQLYLESLEMPMPFYLGTPQRVRGETNSPRDPKLEFTWGESYDFDAQDITYHFLVSRDWQFQGIVIEEEIMNLLSIKIPMLEPGTYFWRVTATNEDGKVQYPFDYYLDAEGDQHSGMKIFYITEGGRVLEE